RFPRGRGPGAGSSGSLLEAAIAADQVVGRTVMTKFGLGFAFELRDDALSQHLAELDAPLIKRVDVPDDALGENAVLVQRNKLSQRFPRQSGHQARVGR